MNDLTTTNEEKKEFYKLATVLDWPVNKETKYDKAGPM